MNRVLKINLLTALITGKATSKQVADFRKTQEPIHLTMNLGGENNLIEQDPDQPTYHIDVYSDGMTTCYDRYPDGRIEYRNN